MAPLSQPKTTAASVVSYYLALRDLRLTTTAARQTLVNAQSARVVNLATSGAMPSLFEERDHPGPRFCFGCAALDRRVLRATQAAVLFRRRALSSFSLGTTLAEIAEI